MPLTSKSWTFAKTVVAYEKDEFGVYEMLGAGDILYIGQGLIRPRLLAHFPDGADPIVGAEQYRVEYTKGKEEAERREKEELDAYYRQQGRYPKFNQKRG